VAGSANKKQVTASMLYNLVACPHRVFLDLNGDLSQKDEPNAFVTLLWDKGIEYEREVVSGLDDSFVDLSKYGGAEKERLTSEAMNRGEELIYSGRISVDGLLGVPDILRRGDGGYVAGDIKSGAGEEGPEGSSRPKTHYAVQRNVSTTLRQHFFGIRLLLLVSWLHFVIRFGFF
jgi:hypothetical protein